MGPLIILNIYILIIIINIICAIYALIDHKYKRLWYFPLPFIFIVLSFQNDLPARFGLYGKSPTIEFIRVRPAVAEDSIRALSYSTDGRVIEFFSDIELGTNAELAFTQNGLDSNNISNSTDFYCKGIQDNKYIYCVFVRYFSPQKKSPQDVICSILFTSMGPSYFSDTMTFPFKYLIKDTTVDNKPNEIL